MESECGSARPTWEVDRTGDVMVRLPVTKVFGPEPVGVPDNVFGVTISG